MRPAVSPNAIIHDDKYTAELSGQIGMNFESGKLEDGIEKQTERTIENVKKILDGLGWNLQNIIKIRIYLTDMKNYVVVNEVYSKHFKSDFPARAVTSVIGLPAGALIEMDCTASGNKIKELEAE